MDLQLTGKRAFISGSTKGIGYAIARALLREGASVVLNGRDQTSVDHAVRRLQQEMQDASAPGFPAAPAPAAPGTTTPAATAPGAANPIPTVSGIAADFSDPTTLEPLLMHLGRIDILINNVGLFEVKPFADISDSDWARYLEVNLMSGVRLSRALLPAMIDDGWGRILFISSESGVNVPADMIHYGVTKAGMLALGNGLAKLTRGTGVTVNTILGGPTLSDGVADAIKGIADAQGASREDL